MTTTLEELDERRAKRKAEYEAAKAAQYLKDREALDALEVEHGQGMVGIAETPRYVPGLPVLVFFRSPKPAEYTRYTDQYGRATEKQSTAGKRDALSLLGRTCWLHPTDEETKKAIFEAFPGLLVAVGLGVAKKAEADAEAEGKG